MPVVSVLVPTHDHAETLPISVASVAAQTVEDIEIVVIGDGVGPATREAVSAMVITDSRISFIDRPKSGRTGEPSRHEVLSRLTSPLVAYHGDDDLMFPDHLATMISAIEDRDFAHPLPVFVDQDGQLRYGPFDASKPWWRSSVYPPMSRNAISLTGVMHTLDSYRRLPYGWRPTPPGIATDHYMWQQYFALPGFRGASSQRATTVKLAAADRDRLSGQKRAEELQRWWTKVCTPDFRPQWEAQVAAVQRRHRWRAASVTAAAFAVGLRPRRTNAQQSNATQMT